MQAHCERSFMYEMKCAFSSIINREISQAEEGIYKRDLSLLCNEADDYTNTS